MTFDVFEDSDSDKSIDCAVVWIIFEGLNDTLISSRVDFLFFDEVSEVMNFVALDVHEISAE